MPAKRCAPPGPKPEKAASHPQNPFFHKPPFGRRGNFSPAGRSYVVMDISTLLQPESVLIDVPGRSRKQVLEIASELLARVPRDGRPQPQDDAKAGLNPAEVLEA